VTAILISWKLSIAMVLRKAGTAFAAGCTIIVTPLPQKQLTCLTLAYLASLAELKPGVFKMFKFDDVNLEQALAALTVLKSRHVGQACITVTIIYVQAGMYDGFAEMLREATAELVVRHGAEKGTTMGPLTTARDLAKAER
jgi:acyl-CoA reductase-like NAD-dependent aldehyde dehydrogenase